MPKLKKRSQPADQHAGARLRMRRKMYGMSQSDLGIKVGITFQQIQKYENGANRMGSSRLQQFANILDVPVPFFFDEASRPANEMPPCTLELFGTNDGLRLAKAFSRIKSAKIKKQIVEFVDELVE